MFIYPYNLKREIFQVLSENKKEFVKKMPKKITKQRLKNVALFYLKRFETSEANLRNVLKRRVDRYAYFDKDFDKSEAYRWIDELVQEMASYKYVDDERFAEIKIRGYLAAGKSPRYVAEKLKLKGIDEKTIEAILENQDYDPLEAALKLAKKKKIGPFCSDTTLRKERRNKDLGVLIRAGFDFDVATTILNMED